MSLDRFDAEKAISHSVFRHVAVLQQVVEERGAIDAEHAVDSIDPERATAIIGESENRSLKSRGRGSVRASRDQARQSQYPSQCRPRSRPFDPEKER